MTIGGWIGLLIGLGLGGFIGAITGGMIVDRYWQKRINDIEAGIKSAKNVPYEIERKDVNKND